MYLLFFDSGVLSVAVLQDDKRTSNISKYLISFNSGLCPKLVKKEQSSFAFIL